MSYQSLIQEMRKGSRRATARLISQIENRGKDYEKIVAKIYPLTGRAKIIGITGPPGAGKSTLVGELIQKYLADDKKVAVIAVDPSSPFSGGAILGDRIRMPLESNDPRFFVRSLGTRGKQGGLSHATFEVAMCLDASGYDVILVETAGIGQTELDIMKLAHTVVVALVPESGDAIQVMKAGLMEIADVFVVNKSDRPESDKIQRELLHLVGLIPETNWRPPVVKTQAVNKVGILELKNAIESHVNAVSRKPKIQAEKRQNRAKEVVLQILSEKVRSIAVELLNSKQFAPKLKALVGRKTDPYSVAKAIIAKLSKNYS